MRTALVCVRTSSAAQSIATCASRLGVTAIRTAVSEAELLARLEEAPAELVLADTAVSRPDTVGFTKRVLARAPQALLVLLGHEEPQVAAAAVSAGARGLIRGGDHDLVGTVAKTLLLIGSPRRAPAGEPGAGGGPRATPGGAAPATAGPRASTPGNAGSGLAGSGPGAPGAAGSGAAGPATPPPPGHGSAHVAPGGSGGGRTPEGARTPEDARAAAAAERGTAAAAREQRAGRPAIGAAGALVPAQRGDLPDGAEARSATLTERELQVLRGMAEGKSNAEIGRDLYVSEDTVKTHARRLFRKMRVRDRAHAVAVGFRAGALY